MPLCCFCGSDGPSVSECSDCGLVSICADSDSCRFFHGDGCCFPIRVEKRGGDSGRCLVAARDISKGEKILEDEPFVTGPANKSPPVCLGCLRQTKVYYTQQMSLL